MLSWMWIDWWFIALHGKRSTVASIFAMAFATLSIQQQKQFTHCSPVASLLNADGNDLIERVTRPLSLSLICLIYINVWINLSKSPRVNDGNELNIEWWGGEREKRTRHDAFIFYYTLLLLCSACRIILMPLFEFNKYLYPCLGDEPPSQPHTQSRGNLNKRNRTMCSEIEIDRNIQ